MSWSGFWLTAVAVTSIFALLDGWLGFGVVGGFFAVAAVLRGWLDYSERRTPDQHG